MRSRMARGISVGLILALPLLIELAGPVGRATESGFGLTLVVAAGLMLAGGSRRRMLAARGIVEAPFAPGLALATRPAPRPGRARMALSQRA